MEILKIILFIFWSAMFMWLIKNLLLNKNEEDE